MSQAKFFGGAIYNNPEFKALMNSLYNPLDNMKASVAKLKASGLVDMDTMEYGQYQPVLAARDGWPRGGGAFWLREMGRARLDLSNQPNSVPLSNDEAGVVPLTRCALLDASIRKCFNSDPPICMDVDITEHKQDDPNSDTHEIRLDWDYGNGPDQAPTLLHLTMICPYRIVP